MKYKFLNEIIPQNHRKEVNEKILYLLNNPKLLKTYNITPELIYNSYTGRGGLTGLDFKDYSSYYDFSQAKKEIEFGEFYTSDNICNFIMDILKPNTTDLISDMTSGIGNFCNYALTESNFYLNDNNINNTKIMRYLYPNANITTDDIRNYDPKVKFDIIVGNPPYGLKWKINKEEIFSQFYYCKKAIELLKPLGLLCFIVPNSFMNDEFIDKSIVDYMNNNYGFICQFDLPINSFKSVGINHIETKIMIFIKKSEVLTEYNKYDFTKIEDIEINEQNSSIIHDKYIKPLLEQKEVLKAKLFYENINNNKHSEDAEFNFKIQKQLFDIKRNPKLTKYYNKAIQYISEYNNQKKPENIDWQEWNNTKITKEKVIKYLKNILNKQNKIEQDEVKLVKTNYGLKLKAYSDKTRQYVQRMNNNYMSFNDMIINNNYIFDDKKYYKLFKKKQEQYKNQSQDFNNMIDNKNINNWLINNSFYNKDIEETIKLNNIQNDIVNKMLQKKYGYIQASMGSGKTLMGISYAKYRKDINNTKNTIVVAPSIAINGTWQTTLTSYSIPFKFIKNHSDIKTIQQGDYILITFNMLIKLQNRLKKYLKMISNNYTLLLDESDSICRIDSKRTKATLGTFKKAKYKLLLSGTMTRNNIVESYTQFNLLYGSSINFLSENKHIYQEDKDTKELKETYNNNYMKPIPEYKKGYELFKDSFNPAKITVFGVGKNTQNIYNAEILKKLINKTIITKTFEEIVGKKIYEIVQHTVRFNNNEKQLYYKAINEFYSMKYLFTSTGNPRKDRMMEIIQQINLLLNICQHPQTYKEYYNNSSDYVIPSKYNEVIKLLINWSNKKVAIGCRTLKEIDCYTSLISSKFPNRKLFVITGNISMDKRKEIIAELKKTNNAILLSTQQSLSSSISIDFVNKVIITALSWNWSTLSQYFFRFIRYTSKENKEIHFITYENSLESNLLGLLMAKENLTMFMKNQDVSNDELYEQFGIDYNLIDMLLTKEKDKEGHVYINWGEQNII